MGMFQGCWSCILSVGSSSILCGREPTRTQPSTYGELCITFLWRTARASELRGPRGAGRHLTAWVHGGGQAGIRDQDTHETTLQVSDCAQIRAGLQMDTKLQSSSDSRYKVACLR